MLRVQGNWRQIVKLTKVKLMAMLSRAYACLRDNPDNHPFGEVVEELYEHGQFEKLIGAELPKVRK